MINLLGQKEKDELVLIRAKNLAIILGNVVLISLVCLALILLSVKFYILVRIAGQTDVSLGRADESAENLKYAMQKYNAIMPLALSFYENEVHYSDILDAISKIKRPEGLYFKSIFIDGQKDPGKIKAGIAGFSKTRESLLQFKNDFSGQEGIENIYFAPESWINSTNVSFSLTFDIPK